MPQSRNTHLERRNDQRFCQSGAESGHSDGDGAGFPCLIMIKEHFVLLEGEKFSGPFRSVLQESGQNAFVQGRGAFRLHDLAERG